MSQTVLVADDSETIRKIVEMALKASTWDVVGVGSAQDAIEAARHRPSVILLDYYMPDGSGYDVCRTLKSSDDTSTIPVIMLGGTYKNFDEGLARQSGADGIVMKPFKTETLISALETVSTGAGANGQTAAATPASTPQPPTPQPQTSQPQAAEEDYPELTPEPIDTPAAHAAHAADTRPRHPANQPAMQPGSQPRIPQEPPTGTQPRAGSAPDINASSRQASTGAPPSGSSSSAGSGLASVGMNRADFENMVREEVKNAVRNELPGLLRNVMGEIFQQKVLPKLVNHTEQRVDQIVRDKLTGQIREQVRLELERLLSEE